MAVVKDHSAETLIIYPIDPVSSDHPVPPLVLGGLRQPGHHVVGDRTGTSALVVSSFLPGESAHTSDAFPVMGVECAGEFSYWAGLRSQWASNHTLINVERDMEFSDELVAELADCEHPACAYPYQVYPTALGRYIYCATTSQPDVRGRPQDPRWVTGPGDEWAVWSSIGFCKLAPAARVRPLDKLFWQWLEHGVNRVVSQSGLRWHLHWPEIRHNHDYEKVPDHLW